MLPSTAIEPICIRTAPSPSTHHTLVSGLLIATPRAIEELCGSFKAGVEKISEKDLTRTVLDIITGGNRQSAGGLSIPPLYSLPEIIVFSDTNEEELKRFLDEYRLRGIEKIKLKAMVTPFNLSWSLYELVEHLKEEARID